MSSIEQTKRGGVRVAFLGNMNNNHFAMVRFLRDCGIDADLLLFENEYAHFHPSADTYELSYRDYTRQLSWGSSASFLGASRTQIQKDLAPYDVLIGCGFAPAFCEKAGRHLDIFIPYGNDIWTAGTFYRLVSPRRLPSRWSAVFYQRRGIPNSRIIHLSVADPIYEKQYEIHKGRSERWIDGLPMVYSPTYDPKHLDAIANRTHLGHEFRRLRDRYDLMVISHARHYWKCSAENAQAKGTDKLLRAWALFRRKSPTVSAVLVTLEYGKDVIHSKALIEELGIADSVIWLPKMLRKDVMVGLKLADIVCAEFEKSWMTSGVLYEALVLGKPILAWRDDDYYRSRYPKIYPILNARDPESIAARLAEYLANPEACKRMGEQGRQWYEEEVVKKAIDKYLAYISARAVELGRV